MRMILCLLFSLFANWNYPLNFVHADDTPSRFWFGGTLGAGFQTLSASKTTNTSKTGTLINAKLLGEQRFYQGSILGVRLGFQQTSQEGQNNQRFQLAQIRNFVLDLYYLYPVFQRFSLGLTLSNQIGKGVQFNFEDLNSVQSLVSVGPQVRYTYRTPSMEYIGGVELLYGLNSPGQKILSPQLFFGAVFPLGGR